MAQIESWFTQDLKKPVKVQMLNGNLFSQDNQGNLIGVKVYDDDEPASLAGTVSANIIRADGGTVVATGTLDGNKCIVVLPEAAYAVPGIETIVVKLTSSGVVTTLLAVVVTIYRSSTETAVDPGTVMPSIQSLIQQINTAVASIPADYSSLWTSLAPAFSTDASYTAGQYVTYNSKVWRFNAAHSGEWAAGDVSEVKLGNELTDLKSALEYETGYVTGWIAGSCIITNTDPIDITPSTSGIGAKFVHLIVPCTANDSFHIKVGNAHSSAKPWTFVDSSYHVLSQSPTSVQDTDITAPVNAAYLICNARPNSGVLINILVNKSNDISNEINTAIAGVNSNLTAYQKYVSSVSSSTYSNLLANITDNIISVVSVSDGWTDMPMNISSGIFENRRYSNLYQIQFIRGIAGNSSEYTRIVKRSDNTVYRDWVKSYRTPLLRILAVGDSICRGGRNDSKGFIGDLGFPYINMGVGGATISSIHSTYNDSIHQFSDANNIPNQLISYYGKSDADILSVFGVAKFTPDIIVAEGGINDYNRNGTLGTMSSAPVSNDTEASALDLNTVIGATEYLFYQMIKLYHSAQRYFVITHKAYFAQKEPPVYAPTTINTTNGFTQKQLHDALVAVCNLYGVVVIDVYQNGIMDTLFSQYRAVNSWSSALDVDYCDKDGIHPLKYGYTEVYNPLILEAIRNATRK